MTLARRARGVREDARGSPSRASTRAEAPGLALAGRARRAAHAARCSRSTSATSRSSGSSRASLDDAGAEELGARPCGDARGGRACFGDPRARAGDGDAIVLLGPLRLPNEPAEDWRALLRGAAPAAARAQRPRARRAVAARARGGRARLRAPGRARAGPSEPPARLHGDLWGGNVMADADGRPVADRPLRLRRPSRGRPRDAAAVRRAAAAGVRRLRGALRRWRRAGRSAWTLYQLLPLLVHAVLFGGSYRRAAEAAVAR